MIFWKAPKNTEYTLELFKLSQIPTPKALHFLSSSDLERLEKIGDPKTKENFLKCRWILLNKLHEISTLPFDELEFSLKGYGKPFLKFLPELSFNISHKDDYCLLGFSQDVEIGVDLEVHQERPYKPKLADKVLTASEKIYIESSSEPGLYFLKAWSLKEAIVKLNAGSMINDAKNIKLDLMRPAVLSLPKDYFLKEQISLELYQPQKNLICSVASAKKEKDVSSNVLS